MTDKDPSLDAAYALETPEDSKRLYATWAADYDQTFAEEMDYQAPRIIGAIYAEVADRAQPVLDVGAGTGLVARDMPNRDGLVIDALDISPQMLEAAGGLGAYRNLIQADLTGVLPLADQTYGAVISAGTFTHGHVGPDAIDELLRVAKPGAVFVLGINAQHFAARGFEAKFAELEPHIEGLELRNVRIYGPGAEADHKDDEACVAVFTKR